jgi:aryl-alcohol dehydrogenase-like predicted oxidoreductase
MRVYKEASKTSEVDREKACEIIRYAVDHGINYFDTATSARTGPARRSWKEAAGKR